MASRPAQNLWLNNTALHRLMYPQENVTRVLTRGLDMVFHGVSCGEFWVDVKTTLMKVSDWLS